MQIQVQLFSTLRDCLPPDAERGQAMITLPEGASVADLLAHLGIDRRLGYGADQVIASTGWQVIVSDKYESDPARILQDQDRVRIFPPVAGG